MKRLACLVCLTVILIVGLMIGVLGLCLIASAVIGHVEVVAVGALLIIGMRGPSLYERIYYYCSKHRVCNYRVSNSIAWLASHFICAWFVGTKCRTEIQIPDIV